MNHEEFGTAEDYYRAFRVLLSSEKGIHHNHIGLLRAHFESPDHTAPWSALAEAVGYKNWKGVNLQYGILAKRVGEELGYEERPRGFWLFILVDWAHDFDPIHGHTLFTLRRPVIEALERLHLIGKRDPRRRA